MLKCNLFSSKPEILFPAPYHFPWAAVMCRDPFYRWGASALRKVPPQAQVCPSAQFWALAFSGFKKTWGVGGGSTNWLRFWRHFTQFLPQIKIISIVMLSALPLSCTASLSDQKSPCATTEHASTGRNFSTWDPTWFGLPAHLFSNTAC